MERNCVGDCEGLTFWLAQPEDYEEVMSMSEGIYGGNDYLPHRYHEWLEEPGRTVILARSEGKLVRTHSSDKVQGYFIFGSLERNLSYSSGSLICENCGINFLLHLERQTHSLPTEQNQN